jgi:hypothetical protein
VSEGSRKFKFMSPKEESRSEAKVGERGGKVGDWLAVVSFYLQVLETMWKWGQRVIKHTLNLEGFERYGEGVEILAEEFPERKKRKRWWEMVYLFIEVASDG